MSRKSYKSEDTRYTICRAFGTRLKTELITESLENKANAPLCLTTPDGIRYNMFGSVEEVLDENR